MEVDMEDKLYLKKCGDDDVLSFGSAMLKVGKLREAINRVLSDEHSLGKQLNESLKSQNIIIDVGGESRGRKHWHSFYEKWLDNGVDCEILKLGINSWQKGKVKIKLNVTLEFCPDEPEIEEISARKINPTESSLKGFR